MSDIRTEAYKPVAQQAITDPILQKALAHLQERFGRGTAQAYRQLPEGPDLRKTAHAIRMRTILNLDRVLERLASRIRANGGHVFFAENAAEAVDYTLNVARRHGVRLAVKGKSMVTEEIGLNRALENAGIEACETDLGEFIIQLAGEHPSHIIAPAIHKTRHAIGELFAKRLGIEYTDDPPTLTKAARHALRQKFMAADMGISGCNLACAETGHLTLVSNEGNIRMSTTLPPVHVAITTLEKVTAGLDDYEILFRLLPRAAAAQKMSTYVSYIGGPRQSGQVDGPDEFHLVLLDNGRSKILADPELREILCCLRCAACLNVCPVYAKIGGHAYGYPYCGPVGAVLTPLLVGINRAQDLCLGETLCGACMDACPVNIDIPRLLLALRTKLALGDKRWGVQPASRSEHWGFRVWAQLVQHPRLYRLALHAGAMAQKVMRRARADAPYLPGPLNGWTQGRALPSIAAQPFRSRWQQRSQMRRQG